MKLVDDDSRFALDQHVYLNFVRIDILLACGEHLHGRITKRGGLGS